MADPELISEARVERRTVRIVQVSLVVAIVLVVAVVLLVFAR